MKKIILAVFLVSIFGIGAWYAQEKFKGLSLNNEDVTSGEVNDGSNAANMGDDLIKSKFSKSEPDLLQEEAIRLARRPIIAVGGISETSLASAKAKINNAVNLIEANYDYDASWLELGAYRRMIGDNDGALEAWHFLSKIRPNAFVAYHNIGDLYAFTIRDYDQGEKYLLKSIAVGPGNIQGYMALTNLYSIPEFGKQEEAPKVLLKGIANNPEHSDLYLILGGYYRDNGDIANAILYFEKSLLLDPGNARVREEVSALKARQ